VKDLKALPWPSFFMDTELQQLAKTDRNPVQETRYQELLRQQGSSVAQQSGGQYSTGQYGGDVFGLAQQLTQFGQQNIAPVVSSLKDRYKVLLDQIGQTASTEMGRRGIPVSSTSAQEYINKQQLDAATAQNEQLAGIQAQPGQNAIGQAMSLAQMQQQNSQYGQDYALQKLTADRNYELAKMQESRLSTGGGGGVGSTFGGFQPTGTTSMSQPPKTSPTSTSNVQPTGGFKPIGTTQATANSSYNPSPFSGQNIQYAGQKIAKAIQPVAQKAVSTVSNVGKNIYSSASNLFKSLFG
jgi:hypothetical protein